MGAKVNETKEEIMREKKKAEQWDNERICQMLERASKLSQKKGYSDVLKERAQKMDNYELQELFRYVYQENFAMAYRVLGNIMVDKGLAEKDDNGRFRVH